MASLQITFAVLALSAFIPANSITNEDTLKLVFAVFRHGDRTNDAACTWPKDPHRNETYYPYGIGQLTKEGKQRMYGLGKYFRRRYNKFLGNCYTPDQVDAVSTEYNRTKATLQLVLAGLYPPRNTCMEWQKELDWQPIPYNYLLFEHDHVMSIPMYYCTNYIMQYDFYIHTPEGQQLEQKYAELYPYLSYHTGLNVTKLSDLCLVYFGLRSQKEWGFDLPIWAYGIYTDYLEKAAGENYVHSSATTELKQLTAGFLLKQIIDRTQLKLTNKLTPPNRKIFLYSGHEYNVAYLLRALDVFTPHVPQYGACVIIEVHTINGVDGIEIYYEDYTGNEPRPLRVPGCDYFCPFKKFVKLVKKYLPASDDMCGENLFALHENSYRKMRYF